MKKLLTILLILISFSSFAQFEAGEFVNSDTAKIKGSSIIYPHADSVEQFYYSKMRDPSEPLDGVNLRTLFDRLASLDTLGLNVSDLVSGSQLINTGETQIFFPSAFDSTNVIVVPFVRRISDDAVIDFTINDIDSLGFDVVVWEDSCKIQYVASQKITHSSDIFKEPIYSSDSTYLKSHVRNDFDLDSTNEIQDLSGFVPFEGANRDLDLGANSISTDTVKINGVPLLLNTFKKDSLGGAGNIFYSTGASSQPASGSVNQVIGGNSLTANYLPKWDGSKFANSLILEGTKQINIEGVINTNTEDVVVSLKNKYRNLLSYNSNALLIFQDSIYSGSSYVSNFGYGFGHGALQNNSGANSNGFGYQSLRYNSGSYSNGYGFGALQYNTGSNSNGFGHYALQYNTGSNSNGFGHYALQYNTGSYSNGYGFGALQSNSGSYSNGFGSGALQLNSGSYSNGYGFGALQSNSGVYSNGFGTYSLRYNNYANAIGIGHQSTSVFNEDLTTTKNFTDSEVTANTITFIAAHGFGANGAKVNLKFKTVAGSPPTGLANNSVYQFTITSATVLTLAGIGTNASLDFEGSLTKNLNITNSIAIGTDVNATKQNQIVLGSSTYSETLLFGNVGIKKTPTEALDVNGDITGDTVKVNKDLIITGEIYNEINHLYGMVFDSTIVITLTQGVWQQATNATKTLYSTAEQDGITILGDTIVFSKAGGYDVYFEFNNTGIDKKEYHYRILQKNGSTVVRSYNKYSSTGIRQVRNEKAYVHVEAGSKVWCEIMSPSVIPGDVTIQGAKVYAMQRYLTK